MTRRGTISGAKLQGCRILLSLLAWAGLSLNLSNPGRENLLLNLIASFRHFDLAWYLLAPGLYVLFSFADRYAKEQNRWTRLVPACFLGLNMVLGYAFEQEGSWSMLLSLRDGQLLKALFVWAAWTVILDRLLILVYYFLDTVRVIREEKGRQPERTSANGFHPLRWYKRMLREHTFLTPFLTLLIIYIPHFLIACPAVFMGDTYCVIVQAYPELGTTGVDYLPAERVMRAGVYINQHHPVVYTLCLHGFLRLGETLFHSLNAGVFLFCLLQATGMLAVFAGTVSALAKREVKGKYLIALLLFYVLNPQVRNYLFMVTKDGPYAACFLMLLACFFGWRAGDRSRKNTVLLCLSALGVILLRSEGKYVMLVAGVLMAWMDRGNRRALLGFTAVMMVLSLSITRGLYPALGYTKGGRQEALSVPFQQTARYLRDYPEEVTEEERAAIDGVLEYDRVAERYVPSGSASVKILFRQDATNADLLNYFRTWARMLLKHPGTYFQATYANYDQYLYPGEVRIGHHDYGWSAWMMEFTNDQIEPLGKRFSYPVWNERFRFIADSLVDAGLYQVPPFSLLMMPATYCWGLIILFFWTFSRRRGSGRRVLLMLMAASCVQFLVMFVGPLNGYNSRYLLTLTAVLPALALMLLAERGKEEYHRAQIERRRGREA